MEIAPLFADILEDGRDKCAYWLRTDDGLRIRAGVWGHTGGSNGTILLCPGRTEYIELQDRIACRLVSYGYTVIAVDWRGHGLSDRTLKLSSAVHVQSFRLYQLDVKAVLSAIDALCLTRPLYLVGNSMGGAIGLRALIDGASFAAAAFVSPMWGIKMSMVQKAVAEPVSWLFCRAGFGHKFVPGHDDNNYVSTHPFDGNRVTNNLDGFHYWFEQTRARPALQTSGSTMRWLLSALRECGELSMLDCPDIPCVAFFGDEDGVVDETAIKHRMSSWASGHFVPMKNAKHGLLFENRGVVDEIVKTTLDVFSQCRA